MLGEFEFRLDLSPAYIVMVAAVRQYQEDLAVEAEAEDALSTVTAAFLADATEKRRSAVFRRAVSERVLLEAAKKVQL